VQLMVTYSAPGTISPTNPHNSAPNHKRSPESLDAKKCYIFCLDFLSTTA
jgi:hypothetical protein